RPLPLTYMQVSTLPLDAPTVQVVAVAKAELGPATRTIATADIVSKANRRPRSLMKPSYQCVGGLERWLQQRAELVLEAALSREDSRIWSTERDVGTPRPCRAASGWASICAGVEEPEVHS